MSVNGYEENSNVSERRGSARIKLSAPVKLHLPAGVREGVLCDLSESGALIRVDNPPAPGASVMMRWEDNEEFCWVVWTQSNTCGVRFERPISLNLVLQTAAPRVAGPSGPAADHTSIPLGQKRRRLAPL